MVVVTQFFFVFSLQLQGYPCHALYAGFSLKLDIPWASFFSSLIFRFLHAISRGDNVEE
jgi:hypothetical protein